MSERKVLNKYYPPDFDPSKIPRRKQPKDKQDVIRLMAPFSMRCKTCGHYIGVGKKFNGRKETVQNETYLGLRIFRLYFKCPMCSSEITIKTDPRNSDYTVEHGVTRNFEPWRENKEQDKDADPLAHIIAEEGLDASDDDEDPMKALEARQEESRREMEVMDALQDMQNRNARLDRVDTADVLGRVEVKGKAKLTAEELEQKRLEEEDEKLVQRYFGRDLAGPSAAGPKFASDSPASHSPETPGSADAQPAASTAGMTIKRLQAYDDEDDETASKAARVANREPDIHAVLSERAREQLLSATAKVGASATASKSHPVVSSSAPKRKKQASAFGIVRKKA